MQALFFLEAVFNHVLEQSRRRCVHLSWACQCDWSHKVCTNKHDMQLQSEFLHTMGPWLSTSSNEVEHTASVLSCVEYNAIRGQTISTGPASFLEVER